MTAESMLAQRMRDAADTIAEFNARMSDTYTPDAHWRPSELRTEADHVEAEDRAEAERAELVTALARELTASYFSYLGDMATHISQQVAKRLIDEGWCKA